MKGVGKRTLTLDSSWSNELENVDPKHVAEHLSVVSVGAPGMLARGRPLQCGECCIPGVYPTLAGTDTRSVKR